MNWIKPNYDDKRFGFEVTMYIGIKSTPKSTTKSYLTKTALVLAAVVALGLPPTAIMADTDSRGNNHGGWHLFGFDRQNSADSSRISRLNKTNYQNVQLKWIFNIPSIPIQPKDPSNPLCTYPGPTPDGKLVFPCPMIKAGTNPAEQPRPYYGAANGVSVDRKGRVYFPTFDGRFFVLDSKNTVSSLRPDLTVLPTPKVLNVADFWVYGDPDYTKYTDPDPNATTDKNVYISRAYPTLVGNALYVGNHGYFSVRTEDVAVGAKFNTMGLHYSNPSAPDYVNAGAVLYKLDKRDLSLLQRIVVDDHPQGAIPLTGITPIKNTDNGQIVVVPFIISNIAGNLGIFPVSPVDSYDGHCCDGRAGLAGVRVSDGRVVWKTYMMPKQDFDSTATVIANGKVDAWTGGNIWGGGHMPYSKKHGLVFATTGEAYSAPIKAQQCELNRVALLNPTPSTDPDLYAYSNECLQYDKTGRIDANFPRNFQDIVKESTSNGISPSIYSPKLPLADSVVAVDVNTGKIKWAQPVEGFDIWNVSCLFTGTVLNNYFCSADLVTYPFIQLSTKDKDLSGNPVLVENIKMADGTVRDVLITGGKGATLFAFDAKTGEPLWQPTPIPQNVFSNTKPAGVNFGRGAIDGGGFSWGLATDGKRVYGATGGSNNITLVDWENAKADPSNNPKKIIVDSCIRSGFYAFYNTNPYDPTVPATDKTWGGTTFNTIFGIPRNAGQGGMYVAVDIAKGQIVWQRCALGMIGDKNRTLKTKTPIEKCVDPQNQNLPVSDPLRDHPIAGETCAPRNANAGPSLANGILIVSGVTNYVDGSFNPNPPPLPIPEILLLDASTGKLLKELPMGDIDKPIAMPPIYSRTISVGRNLFASTGSRKPTPDPACGINCIDTQKDLYRVIMYQLPSLDDDTTDDNDENSIHEED